MQVEPKFEKMGARIQFNHLTSRFRGLDYRLDVSKDKEGEYFNFQIAEDVAVTFEIADLKPKDRHLLLFVRDEAKTITRFLCGHDERHWFVAPVPGNATSVEQAKESLKPAAVRESQVRKGVSSKEKNKRKNAGFIRQGEWFFVPVSIQPDSMLVLRNEPLRRGGGTAHIVEELYREGGTTVHVSREFPNGLTDKQYKDLLKKEPEKKNLSWQVMRRNPTAYARGKIRHPDHKTIELNGWHRIHQNTEPDANVGQRLAFLD